MNLPRSSPPVLETARLVLQGHTKAMLEPLSAMWADPQVVRHIGAVPSTPRESWMRMLSYRGLWPLLGYGYWAICEKNTGRYVGDLGFADFKRNIDPPIRGIPEAGWALARWSHGRGYATEALGAALAWLDRETPFGHSVCLIAPENRQSIRVAEKSGFVDPQPRVLNDRVTLLLGRGRGKDGGARLVSG